MTAQAARPAKPTKPYNRHYNRKRVVTLAQAGIPPALIAKDQDVAISTITRYLDKIKPQLGEIKRYTNSRADALALSQLKLQALSDAILDEWIKDPAKLTSQDIRLQKEVLVAVQGAKTYEYNSERLERGQSTSNQAMIHADIAALRGAADDTSDPIET